MNKIWILIGSDGFHAPLVCPCASEMSVYSRILEHANREEDIRGAYWELTWHKEDDTTILGRHGTVIYVATLMEIYTTKQEPS